MSLSSVSINRPVLSTVFAIVILLFGMVGLTFLGIREFPSVDPPIISVSTSYPGANSDVIETQITEPLEQSINGIQGIRSLTSVSRQGGSDITVEFELSVDMETAANDTRDKVSQAMRMLPRDCDPPVVAKADADANPILQMTIESDKRSLLELSEIAELEGVWCYYMSSKEANGGGKGLLLFSNPAVPKGRDHLTIRLSEDDGKTWPKSRLICEGSSAYSSLAVLPSGDIGLLYERDNYKNLTLARFGVDWIGAAGK